MQRAASLTVVSLALALGACAMPEVETFRMPDFAAFKPRSTAELRQSAVRPVMPEDLVDAEGRCAAAAEQTGENVPVIPPGIALEMTECDVVKRVGTPEKVQFGTNERNDRTAVLTYIHGSRPGIYHFTGGRLTSMERAPEPPAPAKPARPQRQQQRRAPT